MSAPLKKSGEKKVQNKPYENREAKKLNTKNALNTRGDKHGAAEASSGLDVRNERGEAETSSVIARSNAQCVNKRREAQNTAHTQKGCVCGENCGADAAIQTDGEVMPRVQGAKVGGEKRVRTSAAHVKDDSADSNTHEEGEASEPSKSSAERKTAACGAAKVGEKRGEKSSANGGEKGENIKLSELIAPSFYALHREVQSEKHLHTHYLLFGGRGSCKSTFTAIEVILLIKKYPLCHALILRKVAATVRDSVYSQYICAAELLRVSHEFEQKLSPPELIYKPTGQRILFRGADDRAKIKSLKMPFGYIGITHFEEKDQFESRAEIRSILQSTMRGGAKYWNFETCNPPIRPAHWANSDALMPRADAAVHRSDYRSVPRQWLGEQFFAEAQMLKNQNFNEYRHEYLGEAVGVGASVFTNVRVQAITSDEIKQFDRIYMGCDWGYFPDPFAFVKAHFDAARRILYIFDEICVTRQSNAATAAMCKAKGAGLTVTLWADSAEPKSIADYKASGILCRAAGKGAGSVPYSMKWLASLNAIVIDAERCPACAQEFTLYEHERDKDGNVTEGYPDRDNHCIDAVRYAMYPVWRRKGQ